MKQVFKKFVFFFQEDKESNFKQLFQTLHKFFKKFLTPRKKEEERRVNRASYNTQDSNENIVSVFGIMMIVIILLVIIMAKMVDKMFFKGNLIYSMYCIFCPGFPILYFVRNPRHLSIALQNLGLQ